MKKNRLLVLSFTILFLFLSFFMLDGLSLRSKLLTALNIPMSSTRSENYDKLKIEVFKITERLTGTEPFNIASASDTNGVDVSPDDNYVRTNDTINYTLEVRIQGTSNYEDKSGGIIKVKGILPNQGNPTLMIFEKQAWMKNTVLSEDQTEIYAEYHFDSAQTPIGNQTMTFTVKTLGYKKNITESMKPTFEVWMEGNKPDNSSSSNPSMTIKDSSPIIISGHQNLDVGSFNSNGNILTEYQNKKGQLLGIVTTTGIKQDVSDFSDYRGIEYPYGDIDYEYKMEYQYNDLTVGNEYKTITNTTPGANGILNGTSLINTVLNFDTSDASAFIPKNHVNYHNISLPAGKNGLSRKIACVEDSGTYTSSLNANIFKIKLSNYKISGEFPIESPWYSNLLHHKTGFISSLSTQFFIPIFVPNSSHSYNYTYSYTLNKVTYSDVNGNRYVLTYDNNTQTVGDGTIANNRGAVGFHSYPPGGYDFYINPVHGETPSTEGRRSVFNQQIIEFDLTHTLGGYYLGGTDNLLVWDPRKLEMKKIVEDNYYNPRLIDNRYGMETFDASTITAQYGIYKTDPNGPPTESLRIKAYLNDFNWYNTFEEASTHGKVSALYLKLPKNNNPGNLTIIRFRFQGNISQSDIGKTTFAVNKGRAFDNPDSYLTGEGIHYRNNEEFYYSDSYFSPTIYNSSGEIQTLESDYRNGETYIMIGYTASVLTSVSDLDSSNQPKKVYDVQDGVVNVKITPSLTNGLPILPDDQYVDNVKVVTTLPKGLTYKQGSANKTPDSVIYDESTGETQITWSYHHFQVNHEAPDYKNLNFQAILSLELLNNQQLEISSTISAPDDLRDAAMFRTNKYGITIVNLAGSKGIKFLDPGVIDINGNFKVETKIGNTSSSNLINIQTVEVLPKNDPVVYKSKFGGDYTLIVTKLAPGEKMYYTTYPIANSGIYKDASGIYVTTGVNYQTDPRWIPVSLGGTIPANATAIGSMIPMIASKSDASHEVQVITSGNFAKDYYSFVASFTSDNLETSVRTNTVVCYVRDYIIKGMVFKDQQNNNVFDSGRDIKLSNIPVKLYNSNGILIKTTTTDSEGNYIFEYLTKQNYKVVFEVDGTDHIYEVVAKNQGAENVSSVSDLISNTNSLLTAGINNIVFMGNEREIVIDNRNLGIKEKFKVITEVDGTGGRIEGDELVYQGTDSTPNKIVAEASDGYYISKITINGQEISITNKHKMIVDYFRSIQENKKIVVSFKPNKLVIDKVDEDGNKLSGASFEMYRGNTRTHSCSSTVNGCVMEKINTGTYTLKEVAVPGGFALQTTIYNVTVDSNGYISINTVVPDVEVTARIGNKLNRLIINKVDENNQPLAGATLGLYQGNTKKYECVSTTNGCTMTKIIPGEYTLKETAVPAGYALQTTTYPVVVGVDGWISVNREAPVAEKTFKYNNKPNKLTINKVEEGNIPLKDAILGLFQDNVEKYRCTSASDGKCIMTKIVPGEYVLKEIDNPDGYVLIKDTQRVVVSVDGWISVEGREKEAETTTKVVNVPTKIELYIREGMAAYHITGENVKLRIQGAN